MTSILRLVAVPALGLLVSGQAVAAPGAAPPATGVTGAAASVILDQNSLWRCLKAFKYSDVRTAEGTLETRSINAYWGGVQGAPTTVTAWSDLPPADWTSPAFDDSAWVRLRAPLLPRGALAAGDRSYDVALVVARGKFEVKDPGQVRDPALSLGYYGGVVAYVNGVEVARGHVPGDKPNLETLAEDYPAEAFATVDGKPLRADPRYADEEGRGRLARRGRRLTEVKVPAALLRRGANVLAIEVHRAPVHELIAGKGPKNSSVDSLAAWPPIGLLEVRLSAAPAEAVVPNAARPDVIQVWTCTPADTLTSLDYGDPCEPLTEVRIATARNGVFSARLMVSSRQSIKGLAVAVSDLVQADGGGKIPASAVRVRYAEPAVQGKTTVPPPRFDGLLDAIPGEIPVIGKDANRGALAPIWLTIHVPKDAPAGVYAGTVKVAAEGLAPVAVPLRVTVSAWSVPDPKDFRIINFGQSSPDSLARHYGVPLWSKRHFELMAQSMALMAEVNSRSAVAELCLDFYGLGGTAETMVRWIRQPDGTYQHDFTVFDEYLDTVARAMDKPRPLRLACWGEWRRAGADMPGWDVPRKVSLLDPVTGKIDALAQPPADTPEFLAFWRPVLDEIRKKVEARGWFDATTMQHNSYCFAPNAVLVDAFKRLWPDGVWSYTAHNGGLGGNFTGTDRGLTMPVRFSDAVWTHGKPQPRGAQALLKPRPGFWCFTFRGHRDAASLQSYRNIPEAEIGMGHDGYSDFGVDFFPVKDAKTGRYTYVGNGRGTGGPNDGTRALLAPGPDGPVASERFEALREGVQLGEAILFLEKALQEKKISGDLEQRVNRFLDARGTALVRTWFNNRSEDDARLLALAGEVAAGIPSPR